jgi:CHAD domain-containing protein
MAYELRSDESVPEGIRRIVREEFKSAAGQLKTRNGAQRDEAIHEARKSIKKIRAVLRLVQPELGREFRPENKLLRDAGRKLSGFRDAGSVIEVFDDLEHRYRQELGTRTLRLIRRGLIVRKRHTHQEAQATNLLDKIAAGLRADQKRAWKWPLQTDGFPAIAQGLHNTFRRGQRAFKHAQKHPRSENYHDWRKRVKDHWYHVRLLGGLWTDVMHAYEKSLKDLETWLGDDHNLVLLRERIVAEPDFYGKETDVDLLLSLIDKYQKLLRCKALSLGQRVYEEKPRQFRKRMKALWQAWQAGPAINVDTGKEKERERRNRERKTTERQHIVTLPPPAA